MGGDTSVRRSRLRQAAAQDARRRQVQPGPDLNNLGSVMSAALVAEVNKALREVVRTRGAAEAKIAGKQSP